MTGWIERALRGTAATRGRPVDRWDWMLAAVLAALVIVEIVIGRPEYAAIRVGAAAVALTVLPFRRQLPVVAALVAFGAQFMADVFGAVVDVAAGTTFAHGAAGLLLIYALCRWPAPVWSAVGMVITMMLVLVGEFLDGEAWWQNVLYLSPWLALALLALAMRYRATLSDQREQQIRLGERNALARELHDSVAHHVSAIAVQAQAAQFVAATDPAAAVTAMGAVEEIANSTIDEMRRLVGILRSDDDAGRTVAATSLATFDEPVGSPRVSNVGEVELSGLSAPVAAAVYRIVQESITNARRHCRNVTFVDVALRTGSDEVTLEIVNDGTPTTRHRGGGYGLVGMAERVEALGGTISTGPRPTNGWHVDVVIPLARTR